MVMGLVYCLDSGTLRCTYVFAWMFAYLGCSLLSALGSQHGNKASRLDLEADPHQMAFQWHLVTELTD